MSAFIPIEVIQLFHMFHSNECTSWQEKAISFSSTWENLTPLECVLESFLILGGVTYPRQNGAQSV